MNIKVTASFDRIKKLQEKFTKTEVEGALDDTLKEVSDMWYEDAHEITGTMKSHIGYRTEGFSGEVFCDVDYASLEVERGGLHDFTARGLSIGKPLLKEKMEALLE